MALRHPQRCVRLMDKYKICQMSVIDSFTVRSLAICPSFPLPLSLLSKVTLLSRARNVPVFLTSLPLIAFPVEPKT